MYKTELYEVEDLKILGEATRKWKISTGRSELHVKEMSNEIKRKSFSDTFWRVIISRVDCNILFVWPRQF